MFRKEHFVRTPDRNRVGMMPDDWIFRAHIRIPEERIRRQQKKHRQPPPSKGKRKDPRESGRVLISQLDESVRYCNRPEKVVANEGIFFIIRTDEAISFQEAVLNRFSLRLSLQTDKNSAVVFVDAGPLEKFRDALLRYMEKSELHSYLDRIDSISVVKFNRASPELSNWLTSSNEPLCLEIEILPNLNEEQYKLLIDKLSMFLREQGDKLLNLRVREGSASLRAFLKPQTARMVVQGMDSIWQARRAPRIITERPQSMKLEEYPKPKLPEANAKPICVLDTGVDNAHPFLKDALIDAVDLTSDNSPQDFDGHGTFVAGLAAYGDLENRADPQASARIISVKVLGKDPNDYSYLENLVEQAVRRFHEHVKLFSMSVMYTKCCDIDRPSELAYTIDKLSRDYEVLFSICTGNVQDELQSLVDSMPYPAYLSDRSCRIFEGGEACTPLTVGGVANKDSDISIARKGEPSPFTRRGETGKRGKPDVVSWAGNIERVVATSGIQNNNEKLGIHSLGLSPDILAYGIGTSYAAPVVANILARLSSVYPEAGPNLLKALVIHFAYWPDEHFRLNAGEELKKNLYGKGTPEFQNCAYSTTSCAAYILEDSLGYDKIAWVPIYIPKIMRRIYGEKRIRVTLVYDPPVDRGISGYSLVDLDFHLYKQYRIQRKWDRLYRRQWDNVKTDVFRWQKGGWGKDWALMIFPRLRFKDRIANLNATDQKFAVVVSIEDPSKKFNIYDAIVGERKEITLEPYLQAVRRNKQLSTPRV